MNKLLGVTVLVALLAGACSDSDTVESDESGDSASVHDEWVLVGGPVPEAAFGVTTLRIDVDGGAGGSTACNGYFADGPAVDGDEWLAVGFSVTAMGCQSDLMDAQFEYLEVLAAMSVVTVSETSLQLSDSDGTNILRFDRVIPPPDSALVDTTWVLESMIEGDAVSSTIGGAEHATLVFGGDGSVTGTDGCGSLSGSYEMDGDRIRLNVAIDPGTGCDDRFAAQSAHIEDVLAADTTYRIDGPRLVLTAPDGTGLEYRDRP